MQFETIAVFILALGVLVFLFARRRVITGLQEENAALGSRLHKLGEVAERQRREIDALMATAQAERRARQMATLSSQPTAPLHRNPRDDYDPFRKQAQAIKSTAASKQEETARHEPAAGNTWDSPPSAFVPYSPSSAPAPVTTMAEATYQGAGGSFDGGGASGDYGSSSSSSCDSSSSASSDSGSSSSSDSSCSSSSGD